MNNWTVEEIAFRCDRLPMRIDRLTTNLLRMGSLSSSGADAESTLAVLRESKVFIELIAIDLDIDSAFELAQMQRQLSRWHIHWVETWSSDFSRGEILRMTEGWVDSFATCQTSARMHSGKTVAGCAKGDRLREMSGVFA